MLKASDTVLQITVIDTPYLWKRFASADMLGDIRALLDTQADKSYRAGIKEVVDWLKPHYFLFSSAKEWNAKLKEWGIKGEEYGATTDQAGLH